MKRSPDDMRLMHSVMDADEDTIKDGKLITESINQGMGSFMPDMIFEKLVQDYRLANKLYGETIIRELCGYDPSYIQKNAAIPEFKRELKQKIDDRIKQLKKEGYVDESGQLTRKGIKLSSLIMYTEELDHLVPKGFGGKREKPTTEYGEHKDIINYSHQRYRDLSIRHTVRSAIRRGHDVVEPEDLKAFSRQQRGKISIIYALDSSGSMKGEKLKISKKAGIALAFKAVTEKNDVGLITFDSKIKAAIDPCQDFSLILEELTKTRAGMETDIKIVIEKSIEMFPRRTYTKHLLLITDALPTKGKDPVEDTLRAVSAARDSKITISIVGINLDEKGLDLAKKIVQIGEGRLYLVKDMENLDKIVLEDYYALA
ncbi:MAG: VWA domain-containing protein [Nanoarchaeota archaeon]